MYKKEFDNLLKQNKTFSAYMFYGQSTYMVEHYASLIAKSFSCDEDIEKVYFDEYNFRDIKNKLLQNSLFASNNILIVKVDKKIDKKEVKELIEASMQNPISTLIFACLGDSDFKNMALAFTKKLEKDFEAICIRFFLPFDSEALKILGDYSNTNNISIDNSSLNHLYFMHKQDLNFCINDLRKLSILNESISTKVIDNHCFGITTISMEDFLHNLISGKHIGKDLYYLLEEGVNEIFLLTQVTSFVQQLFMISAYARTIGNPDPKEILGFTPPKLIWEKKSKLAINIKPEKYLEMLDFLLELELEFKTSKVKEPNLYLQASLRKFSALFG
ncbi:MAG: DNA polymerase III subunit delta [Campylobacteraceae bacterium]|nr:DNA polymerase III subunit delta [Campylobacteraceae bacterium]